MKGIFIIMFLFIIHLINHLYTVEYRTKYLHLPWHCNDLNMIFYTFGPVKGMFMLICRKLAVSKLKASKKKVYIIIISNYWLFEILFYIICLYDRRTTFCFSKIMIILSHNYLANYSRSAIRCVMVTIRKKE